MHLRRSGDEEVWRLSRVSRSSDTTLVSSNHPFTDRPLGPGSWRSKGRGKRGGSRVIYYWLVSEGHIYLLTLYGKGVKDDLTPAERAAWRKVVEEIANG